MAHPLPVRAFIRRFRTEILARWRRAARELPAARTMDATRLLDHIPEVLDEIAENAEQPRRRCVRGSARRHALDRLAEGFDVSTIVRELSLLRAAIHDVWCTERGGPIEDLTALDLAIDRATVSSVTRFTQAHQRTLAGIDRISTVSFESSSVDDLLQRLLNVFVETAPVFDTGAIYLVAGGRLERRAAVGLDDTDGEDIALADGLAATVAERREPIHALAADVRAHGSTAGRARVRYGVPLVHADKLIGVALAGSSTAEEISDDDRQFVRSVAARATLGIVHHVLREELAASKQSFEHLAAERASALAKLESLLAASPIGIGFVDRELRYQRINDALAAMNRRPAAEHIGRTVEDTLPDQVQLLVPLVEQVLASGEPVLNLQIECDPPGGKQWLLANYFPVRVAGEVTGVGAVVSDVTETRRAQDALRVEQARIQSILEHSPAAIWVKDREGRIVVANHKALGRELSGVIGRCAKDRRPETAMDHQVHDETVLREGRAIEIEEVVPLPGGPRTYLAIKFPVPGDPPLVGAIATDITHRKQMEEELRFAVRARDEILAVVSHDLRNPLGAAQLAASMLLEEPEVGTGSKRHLEAIQRACARMEVLIDDLLDSANLRAGRLKLELRRELAAGVRSEAVELQRSVAADKGITLEQRGDEGPVEILCDRDRVLQVFGNLVGNAIKFCRSGDTITIDETHTRDHVVFSVADTGPGIRADLVPHLFDAYWSAPEHARRGSGLGLYISRGIVEVHGGRIWVESRLGEGSKFFFTIPIAK